MKKYCSIKKITPLLLLVSVNSIQTTYEVSGGICRQFFVVQMRIRKVKLWCSTFFPIFSCQYQSTCQNNQRSSFRNKKIDYMLIEKKQTFFGKGGSKWAKYLLLSQHSKRFSFFESNPPTNWNSKQRLFLIFGSFSGPQLLTNALLILFVKH